MNESSLVEIALFVMTGIFVVLWYLLQQKDAKQQKDIEELRHQHTTDTELLWQKHDSDVVELQQLKLQIASQHYVKDELDKKFDRMDTTMRTGFEVLSGKVDELSKTLITHFQRADK